MSRGEKQQDEGGEAQERADKFQEVPQEQIIQSFNNVILKQISMLKSSAKVCHQLMGSKWALKCFLLDKRDQ